MSTPAIHFNPVTPDNPVTPVTPVAPVTPVRVAVVLSQGDKVLEQLKEEKGKGKGWNKWFQGVGKIEGKKYVTSPLRSSSDRFLLLYVHGLCCNRRAV